MSKLLLKNIIKEFNKETKAVDDFNLEVDDGEFIVFVGGSGCGKTTTLRMIAGLETPTSGSIYIDGEDVSDKEPQDRNIAFVFQDYALYPHMSVYSNLAFSLKLGKMPKDVIDRKIKDIAKILEIENMLKRKPKQLSGGERQRVAIGRALIREPKILLMDEPLSNLDAKLKAQMRNEIKLLQRRLGVTTIYVTHDQVEAMTMGDRIVIMNKGKIMQVGTPSEVYNKSNNLFVAKFIGNPPMNIYYDESNKKYIGIRPEDIKISQNENYANKATIDNIEFLGDSLLIYFKHNDTKFIAKIDNKFECNISDKISYEFDKNKICYFDNDENRIN